MTSLADIARIFILVGFILIVVGGLLFLINRLGISPGNLPGDIRIERGNYTCVFALGTSLILSLLLTLGINLILRLLNR